MSENTDRLIDSLVSNLTPVERLPQLRHMALRVLVAVSLLLCVTLLYQLLFGMALLKAGLGAREVLGLSGHLVLASGALTLALASCVPGRDSLERVGWAVFGLGAGLTAAGIVVSAGSATHGTLSLDWVRSASSCLSTSVIPALVPAALLAQFAARGAPHRPLRTLAYGSVSALGFATAPGLLSCPATDFTHQLIAHQLAPLSGGLLVLGATALSFIHPQRH